MEQEQGRIVVGVDGSPGSRAALAFALRDAARRGAAVEVVATFARPDYWVPPYGVPPISSDEIRDGMHRYVKHTVQEVIKALGGELTEVPPVTLRTVAGSAAGALLEAAEGADLLVVGSRGHGGFSSMLLGLGQSALHSALHLPHHCRARRRAGDSIGAQGRRSGDGCRHAGACVSRQRVAPRSRPSRPSKAHVRHDERRATTTSGTFRVAASSRTKANASSLTCDPSTSTTGSSGLTR